MKKTKIIIPALGMLLLSTAASVSGTVAWFSMNNTVSVTGMTVTTKVSSNLQIADGDAHHLEANYGDNLSQTRNGILEPASTANGQAFYYTTSAAGDGAAKANGNDTYKLYSEAARSDLDNPSTAEVENNYSNALGTDDAAISGKSNYDVGFNVAYGFSAYDASANSGKGNGEVCFGYIDYSFYLKAGYSVAAHRLMMTKCEMLYNGGSAYGSITTAWAWRVGMFVAPATEGTDVTNDTVAQSGNLKTILDFAGSKNQNEVTKAVIVEAGDSIEGLYTTQECDGQPGAENATNETGAAATYYKKGEAAPKAVSGTANTALAALGELDDKDAIVDTNPAINTTKRYKVIVRLWLEGEDISCTSSTFARLTNDWKLDLEFKLGDPAAAGFDPVNNITTSGANQEPNA